jgi:serine/threonine protein kinase
MLSAYSIGRQVWIVMELYDGGDIVEYFYKVPPTEPAIAEAFSGLLRALEYCHS